MSTDLLNILDGGRVVIWLEDNLNIQLKPGPAERWGDLGQSVQLT